VSALIDSSAWIEFLRATESPVCVAVEDLLHEGAMVTDPVVMEILAGARDDGHLHQLRVVLSRAATVPVAPIDFESAAGLHRACRAKGETVRKMIDCLIAAIALRAGLPVLHADRDFDRLARHTDLTVHPVS